ncbi:MAG TPA: hypothetical protein VKP11_09735, partial [Frankiaceae bacterium]|nr:hypothetical protein [Frankiaceae bacterium]
MHRRRVCCLVLPAALAVPLVLAAPAAARPAPAAATPAAGAAPARAGAAPGGPTLSTGDRLGLRRFVVAGTRAYELGTEDGRYPVMGFHTRGEMGGVWSPPIKLLDGLWFGLDGRWLGPATRFTRGYGYTRMELPDAAGVRISRTDVVPDGRRALLVGLTLSSATARTARLTLDAHSELMSVYPWGETTPSQLTANLPDTAAVSAGRLVFRDRGTPPGGLPAHHWAAVVAAAPGSPLRLVVGSDTGRDFRGPQEGGPICPASGPGAPPAPDTCKDTAYGKGAGGQLRYELRLPAGRAVTVWFVAAGSDRGLPAALAEAGGAAAPEAALAAKVAARQRLAGATRLTLPGDPRLARSVEWSKQDLADLLQEARDLRIRETNAGKRYPPPVGTVPRVRFVGAGYPDYPWLFATDGEYTAFALVGLGQFDAAKDHLRALRDVSDVVNRRSGKIVHEVTTDGSVYFGANADPGNTDESVKFPSAVALVWRWTGDDRFRDEMYDSSRRALAYVTQNLDTDGDGWPEGSGNVEREGQGAEKLDNAVYLIRGLYDLAEMADSRGDTATAVASRRRADDLLRHFEQTWWAGSVAPAYADSLRDPGD